MSLAPDSHMRSPTPPLLPPLITQGQEHQPSIPQPEPALDGGRPFDGSRFFNAFDDRVGVHQFQPSCKGWGYVPQLHEWAAKEHKPFEWNVVRTGGEAHMPVFEAYPIWNSQHLVEYKRQGPSKQKAKEASAEAMALSGHC